MEWIQYKIHTTSDTVEMIGELLYEAGIQGFEISDNIPPTPEEEKQMYTDIPAALAPDDGTAVITFYTEGKNAESEKEFYSTGSSLRDERLSDSPAIQSPQEMIALLKQKIQETQSYFPFPEPKIEYSIQDDSQWKDKWKDSFKAFRIADDIIIKPVWEETPDFATAKDTIVQIDPGSAFGTGTHETTKLCLLSLRNYLSENTTILDAGCGSGILAISALLSGARSAFCLDIDPAAVNGTLENASLNHLGTDRIQAVHGNILEDTSLIHSLCPEPFDIAVANILADVIIPLTDYIRPFIKENGIFISSGILAEKADDVEQVLNKNHFTVLEKNTMGEWVSFVAQNTPLSTAK